MLQPRAPSRLGASLAEELRFLGRRQPQTSARSRLQPRSGSDQGSPTPACRSPSLEADRGHSAAPYLGFLFLLLLAHRRLPPAQKRPPPCRGETRGGKRDIVRGEAHPAGETRGCSSPIPIAGPRQRDPLTAASLANCAARKARTPPPRPAPPPASLRATGEPDGPPRLAPPSR